MLLEKGPSQMDQTSSPPNLCEESVSNCWRQLLLAH